MKRIYFIAALLFAAACSEKEALLPAPAEEVSSVIPVQEALDLVSKYAKILYPETRSDLGISVSDATTLTKDIFLPATRANDYPDIPDTTLYIFNFPNNSGYAVTSANRKYGNTLLCLTESGSLTLDDFSPAPTRATGDSTGTGNEGNDFIKDLITASIMANEIAPPDDSLEIGGGAGFVIYENYGPYIHTKWEQLGSPFTDSTAVNCAIGCMTVAVGQIIVANRVANSMVFNGKTCTWDDLESVCHYSNRTYTGSAEAKLQVANFIKVISDSSHCAIVFHPLPAGSTGTMEGAKRTLQSLGYSSVSIHRHTLIDQFTSSDASKVTKQIKQGKPVLMSGSDGSKGHAWIIDGYIKATANSQFYHINWGYNGLSDGYFWVGTFNTFGRFSIDSIDPGYLSDPAIYNSQLQYLTYNL